MNFGFVIDNRKCIGCHACTVACKSEHDVPVGVNRTWVKYIEKGLYPNTRRTFAVNRCNHCADAPCVKICPVGALYMRDDGIVDFDNRRCVGCKACTQACPYNAIYIDPETRTTAKCNYCAHRIDIGLKPACVNICPEQAIIAGDIDDPAAEISMLIARKQVQVRKPEKGTLPKLFYIDGDEASTVPTAALPTDGYMWSEQAMGVGHHAEVKGSRGQGVRNFPSLESLNPRILSLPIDARRTYDAPQKGVMWGWEVSGYIWTKAIATGIVLITFLASLLGIEGVTTNLQVTSVIISMLFLIFTGGLLISDLDRPDRFLYVLLRPNWKSWLVRGAYIITIYGGLLTLYLLMKFLKYDRFDNLLSLLLVIFAALSAVYTAFLFAQAKGRDFWQNPILLLYMFIHSMIGGAAVWLIAGIFISLPEPFLAFMKSALTGSIAIHLLLELAEFVIPHSTKDSHIVSEIISKGSLKYLFWCGAILFGNIMPLILLTVSVLAIQPLFLLLAGTLILAGIYISNHIIVRAPQLIPLS
ncbi:MAG: polysulfide reductase NrfD [Nitrospinae bacterium]|nr:polysulfide reductase NrfD [Nitrospinota bacterium]